MCAAASGRGSKWIAIFIFIFRSCEGGFADPTHPSQEREKKGFHPPRSVLWICSPRDRRRLRRRARGVLLKYLRQCALGAPPSSLSPLSFRTDSQSLLACSL